MMSHIMMINEFTAPLLIKRLYYIVLSLSSPCVAPAPTPTEWGRDGINVPPPKPRPWAVNLTELTAMRRQRRVRRVRRVRPAAQWPV